MTLDPLRRAAVLAGHQLVLAAGIALFPIVLAVRRFGLRFPLHRLLSRSTAACEAALDG